MVGVGGRSKACDQCRRRRVTCDQTRPKCHRCTKAKLNCGGYTSLSIIQYQGDRERRKAFQSREVPSQAIQPKIALPSTLSQASNRKEFLPSKLFLEIKPSPDDVFLNCAMASLFAHDRQYAEVITQGARSLSGQCFLAFATFFFGNEQMEPSVIKLGLQRYGQALKKLNKAIADSSSCRSGDVLEAVVTLTLFEFLMSDNPDGWVSHSVGLEKLMMLSGPQSFTTNVKRVILERSRPSIIFASMILRKATVLSHTEWKTIPWQSDPRQKSLVQDLVDIMADCPQLLLLQDEIRAAADIPGPSLVYPTLCVQIQSILTQLEAWKAAWEITEKGSCFISDKLPTNIPATMLPSGEMRPFWTSNLDYKSLYHGNAVTLYNATLIFLWRVLCTSIKSGLSPPKGLADLPDKAYCASIDICRSVDYHVRNARVGTNNSNFCILFPLRMAWSVLGSSEIAVGEWLTDVVRKIQLGAVGRWAIAGYLLDINVFANSVTL